MRDVNYGWAVRYTHANTASFFFICVYLHIARGLYYGSYRSPRTLLWSIGVIIFILMMAIGFLGFWNSPKWYIAIDLEHTVMLAAGPLLPSSRLQAILTAKGISPIACWKHLDSLHPGE